jgi:hypothetical protein
MKAQMRQGRTPGFRVFADDEFAFFCEVKTAQEDEWLDKQLAAAPPLTLGQFDAVNPAVEYPNVLAIVNGDEGAGMTDLISVLTGSAYCESGEVRPIFREYSEGRIRKEKVRVHLYLWFDEWEPGAPQMFFPEVHAIHHVIVLRCSGYPPLEGARKTSRTTITAPPLPRLPLLSPRARPGTPARA